MCSLKDFRRDYENTDRHLHINGLRLSFSSILLVFLLEDPLSITCLLGIHYIKILLRGDMTFLRGYIFKATLNYMNSYGEYRFLLVIFFLKIVVAVEICRRMMVLTT